MALKGALVVTTGGGAGEGITTGAGLEVPSGAVAWGGGGGGACGFRGVAGGGTCGTALVGTVGMSEYNGFPGAGFDVVPCAGLSAEIPAGEPPPGPSVLDEGLVKYPRRAPTIGTGSNTRSTITSQTFRREDVEGVQCFGSCEESVVRRVILVQSARNRPFPR